jgi:hypothetical protein
VIPYISFQLPVHAKGPSIDAYLIKPVRKAESLDTLLRIVGQHSGTIVPSPAKRTADKESYVPHGQGAVSLR